EPRAESISDGKLRAGSVSDGISARGTNHNANAAPFSPRWDDVKSCNDLTAGTEELGEPDQCSPRPQGEELGVGEPDQYSPRLQGEGLGVRELDATLTGWRAYEAGWHDFVKATLGQDPNSTPLTPGPSPPAAESLQGL